MTMKELTIELCRLPDEEFKFPGRIDQYMRDEATLKLARELIPLMQHDKWPEFNEPRDPHSGIKFWHQRWRIIVDIEKETVCPSARVQAYQAVRVPTCNKGRGCKACWAKWRDVQAVNAARDV